MKQYNFKINGHDYEVAVENIKDGVASVSVNGEQYKVEVQSNTLLKPQPVLQPSVAPASGGTIYTHSTASASAKAVAPAPVASAGGGASLKSPLPGVILDIKVREGESVAAGQALVVLEAMKMENNIDAPVGGVVRQILKRPGDSVLEGDVLLTIES